MDQTFLFALLASIVSSIGGLMGGVLLLIRARFAQSISRILIGFSAGVILSVTLFDLLPEALSQGGDTRRVLANVFVGIIIFFLIERAIASLHVHEDQAAALPEHPADIDVASLRRAVPLVIIGDTVHNFIDGITVAVTFVVSPVLGLATAVSVLFHELPHEIGDFTILLRSGMAPGRVFRINFWSALVAPVGTVLAYFFATQLVNLQGPLLAIATGNLLYLAMTDLMPHLHHERQPARVLLQVALFIIGALVFFILPRA